jgi:hypothetical protein
MNNVIEPGACHWCGKHCGGTCLKLTESTQMKTSDPAYWMLKDGHRSTPTIHRDGCYICDDPEFAAMGLPLCQPCPECSAADDENRGHIPADDEVCDDCGYNARDAYEREQAEKEQRA